VSGWQIIIASILKLSVETGCWLAVAWWCVHSAND